jgi:hypothetical protein
VLYIIIKHKDYVFTSEINNIDINNYNKVNDGSNNSNDMNNDIEIGYIKESNLNPILEMVQITTNNSNKFSITNSDDFDDDVDDLYYDNDNSNIDNNNI